MGVCAWCANRQAQEDVIQHSLGKGSEMQDLE